MKIIGYFFFLLTGVPGMAQIPDAIYTSRIKSAQLYPYGNQLGFPVIRLNSGDQLELHFDDLDGGVKNYSYTFQLCNADWTPAMLSQFDFIKGYSQIRLTTYRISSVAYTKYTHYQASLPMISTSCRRAPSSITIAPYSTNRSMLALSTTNKLTEVKPKSRKKTPITTKVSFGWRYRNSIHGRGIGGTVSARCNRRIWVDRGLRGKGASFNVPVSA